MPDPDPTPKLRILDEGDAGEAEQPVTRLKKEEARPGHTPKPVSPPIPEVPERIQAATRESHQGPSIEPGIEAILDQQEVARSIEQPWGGEGTRLRGIPYGWFVLFALIATGVGIWSIRSLRKGEEAAARVQETAREKVKKEQEDEAGALELVSAVENAVKSYLAADSLEEILPLVRDPGQVRPLIEETLAANPRQPLRFKRLEMFQPAVIEGKPFWVVRAEVQDAPSENLLLEQTGDREVKVDWETHVCYQPMPWDRFATERPVGRSFEFRVWAHPDNHYSHEFSSTGGWTCFRLRAKDSEEHLFGYARTDGEVAKTLRARCLSSRNSTATVILSLRVPEESKSPRGVLIEKLVEPRWARVAPAPKNAP